MRRDLKSFWATITIGSLVHDMEAHLLFAPEQPDDLQGLTFLCGFLLQRSSGAASLMICRGLGGCRGCAGLDKLHVIGWKHSKMAIGAVASPPALVYHLDPSDNVIRVKGDLCVISSLVVI